MPSKYKNIPIAGGDTATPLSIQKRIQLILNNIQLSAKNNQENFHILDCGCGEGDYVKQLREQHELTAYGIEYLQEKVDVAKQDKTISDYIQQGDIEKMNYDNGSFDAVILNEVLEHVPNEKKGLEEIHRILKPNGQLIIFSPNRWFPFETHGVFLKGTKKKIPPYTPFIPYIPLPIGQLFFDYWARNYWQSELLKKVESCNYQLKKRDFIWQTFENISGTQPLLIRLFKPLLRKISNTCEKTPLIRRFGVSQVLI